MRTQINALSDICTILLNERKVGGAVEVEHLRLRSGEEFKNAVITSIDTDGASIVSVGFYSEVGKRYIVHINDISMICEPLHKNVCELNNESYKIKKTAEKLKYLARLCQLNEGSNTAIFKQEVLQIIEDIGYDAVAGIKLPIPFEYEKRKLSHIRIA